MSTHEHVVRLRYDLEDKLDTAIEYSKIELFLDEGKIRERINGFLVIRYRTTLNIARQHITPQFWPGCAGGSHS